MMKIFVTLANFLKISSRDKSSNPIRESPFFKIQKINFYKLLLLIEIKYLELNCLKVEAEGWEFCQIKFFDEANPEYYMKGQILLLHP